MIKIYIIGSVGSGKTTLAKRLSKELNIPHIELDNITWERIPNQHDRKRSHEEIEPLFNEILKEDNWVMENVGKSVYDRNYDEADTIIYLKLPRIVLYKQILMRWVRQKQGKEPSAYPPDFKMLRQMFIWANKEMNNSKLNKLGPYKYKVLVLDHKKARTYKYERKRN